ncbi:MAG: hypothetical protein V1840_02675 [Candidatus Omnitrophota bacterium]
MRRNTVQNSLFGIVISVLLMGCVPLDDVSFARTTMELMIKGRYSARTRLDWPVLKIMTADIGQEYSNLKTSQDRESYEQSFIKSFSEGYKKAGAKASAFFGWRAFSGYKTKDPNMTVVAAYAHDKTTNLLFVISHEGRTRKIVEMIAVRRLGNADAAKNR